MSRFGSGGVPADESGTVVGRLYAGNNKDLLGYTTCAERLRPHLYRPKPF